LFIIELPKGFGFITLKNKEKIIDILRTTHFIKGKEINCKLSIPKKKLKNIFITKPKFQNEINNFTFSSFYSFTNKNSSPLYLRKMFVGGLLPSLTKKDLLNYFSQFGKIEKGIIMNDKLTGKSKGFGFIIFNEKETIDKIMEKGNCHFLNGKLIECKRSKPKIQSIKILHEKEYFSKFNDNENNNNAVSIFNNINKNNDEIIINNSIKSLEKKNTIENKKKFGENLFIYQNYIPKNEMNYISKVNLNNKKIINYNNNYNPNNKKVESQSNIQDNTENKNNNLIKNNSNNIKQLNQFQNYFNNQLKNPSSYHFIHFKLFDSNGDEVSKLSGYKKNNLKIKLFPEELDDIFEKNKFNLNLNLEKENNLDIEKDIKENIIESIDEFGPDRSCCRKEKTRSSIFNNESYKPY